MAKFRITYRHTPGDVGAPPDEEIEALTFKDDGEAGEWIDFYSTGSPANRQHLVLRVRASQVARIEAVKP